MCPKIETNLSGKYLAELLEKCNMTYEQIAEQAQTNKSNLSNWKAGRQTVSVELGLRIGLVINADQEKLESLIRFDRASKICKKEVPHMLKKDKERLQAICFEK